MLSIRCVNAKGRYLRMLQGLELDEQDSNPFANTDGFYPVGFECLFAENFFLTLP